MWKPYCLNQTTRPYPWHRVKSPTPWRLSDGLDLLAVYFSINWAFQKAGYFGTLQTCKLKICWGERTLPTWPCLGCLGPPDLFQSVLTAPFFWGIRKVADSHGQLDCAHPALRNQGEAQIGLERPAQWRDSYNHNLCHKGVGSWVFMVFLTTASFLGQCISLMNSLGGTHSKLEAPMRSIGFESTNNSVLS